MFRVPCAVRRVVRVFSMLRSIHPRVFHAPLFVSNVAVHASNDAVNFFRRDLTIVLPFSRAYGYSMPWIELAKPPFTGLDCKNEAGSRRKARGYSPRLMAFV